jgi:hypothetical protein
VGRVVGLYSVSSKKAFVPIPYSSFTAGAAGAAVRWIPVPPQESVYSIVTHIMPQVCAS